MDAASNGLIDGLEARFMVPGEKQFELRHELEEILPHESRRYFVAAGERFDFAFVPPTPFLSFYGCHKTCTPQASQISRVPFLRGRDECFDGCRPVILAQTPSYCVDKRRFSVGADAIHEKERVCLG